MSMSNTTVANAAKYLRTDDFTMQKYYFYFATRLQTHALYYFMISLLKHKAPCKDKAMKAWAFSLYRAHKHL